MVQRTQQYSFGPEVDGELEMAFVLQRLRRLIILMNAIGRLSHRLAERPQPL